MRRDELAAGFRRKVFIEAVAKLAAEDPAAYAGFLAKLRKAPAFALAGAIALFEANSQLFWLVGDHLAGGLGAEGALHESERCSRAELAEVRAIAEMIVAGRIRALETTGEDDGDEEAPEAA